MCAKSPETTDITQDMLEAGAKVLRDWLDAAPYAAKYIACEVFTKMSAKQGSLDSK